MSEEKIKQVTTKNPKRFAASKKSYEERMEKMMLIMKKIYLKMWVSMIVMIPSQIVMLVANDSNNTKSDS